MRAFQLTAARRRLALPPNKPLRCRPFQLTAARRRLDEGFSEGTYWDVFQLTAARRRLVQFAVVARQKGAISTHSRPKAAGVSIWFLQNIVEISTHSRPKAAGLLESCRTSKPPSFQLTAARRRLGLPIGLIHCSKRFQLTAARRRLVHIARNIYFFKGISTHSRPKAAGSR